jgi:hypothetical protein
MASIKDAILRDAKLELEALGQEPKEADAAARRQALETLIDHLTDGVLSPVVLHAVGTPGRREGSTP